MSDTGKAIFLSYASQDAEAARRIAEALRAAGVEVWFDQSELRGGDSWDQKIRRQIKECTLFLPVISANTQARREGYFRLEWKLAEDRTHLMAKGTPFLVPVCIDDTKDWNALVPDSFMTVQWTRLPGGETPPKFVERIQHLLAGDTTPPMESTVAGVGDPGPASPRPATARSDGVTTPFAPEKRTASWVRNVAVVGGLLIGVIYALRPSDWSKRAERTKAPVATNAPAAVAATSASFPRDPELRRAHKLIYSLDAIAEDYALAEDIVKPLLAARPNDPEVVTVAAEISQEFLSRGFDLTQTRRALAQRLTERAVQLAPDSPEALATLGRYLLFINAQLGRAEELLRRAIELKPDEPRFHRTLFYILAVTRRDAEADAFGARMAAQFPKDPLVPYDIARRYKDANDLVAMEQWFDKTIALAPVAFALTWKAWLALEVHGDADGMKGFLDRIPERQRQNARVANAYYVHALVTGRTATAVGMLNALADPWMTDFDFTGPRALLLGDLLRLDGREDLARLQFEAGLAEIQRVLARDPTDVRPRRAEVLALLALGRNDEARASLRLVIQTLARPFRWTINNSWWNGSIRASLLLGEREQALVLLRESVDAPGSRSVLRNMFKVDPRMAPFRADAEIAALLAEPAGAEGRAGVAPAGEGAQLAARALALYTKVGFTRDDLAPAEDLARRATEREPDSAAAWGVCAGVQSAWLFRGWDNSVKRRQDTQALANRALALDPHEPEALLALGHVLRAQGALDEAEAHLRRACAANPGHVRLARALGFTLNTHGKDAEARAVLEAAAQRAPTDPLVHYELALTYGSYGGNANARATLPAALAQLDAAIALQPFSSALLLKAALLAGWRGDLPATRLVLAQLEPLPLADRAEDRAVCIAMWAGLLEHRPERVEAAAALTARGYFDDNVMPMRPKAWSLALAHRSASKDNLARADWQAAEAVLRQRLKGDSDNLVYQAELAATLAWLDRRDEAVALMRTIEPVWVEAPTHGSARLLARYYAALGDVPKAAAYLRERIDGTVFETRHTLRLDPWWDKLRGQPEFEALLVAAEVKR